MCLAHNRNVKSQAKWRQLCLASISRVGPSRETPMRHFVLLACPVLFTLSVPTLLIPTLPTNEKWELLRENPSQTTWELEIFIPTILYTFVLGISLSLTSPIPYHWEADSPNTYHTLWECQVRSWCCWKALEEAKDGICNMELVAGSGELDKTRFWEALLE